MSTTVSLPLGRVLVQFRAIPTIYEDDAPPLLFPEVLVKVHHTARPRLFCYCGGSEEAIFNLTSRVNAE